MQTMKPELVWVGDRCYRKNPCRNDYGILRRSGPEFDEDAGGSGSGTGTGKKLYRPPHRGQGQGHQGANASQKPPAPAPYVETDLYGDSCEPDAPDAMLDELEFNIEKLESGGFKSRCENIPSGLFSVIIGMKGATKKRIESETNTKIIVPRMNETGFIVVRGQKHQDVASARRRINLITSQARFKREATHFAAFPLNFPHIVEKVREFKEKVLAEYKGVGGIDESIFQDPEKIHLTICVMMLLDQTERQAAEEILEKLKPNISDTIRDGKLEFQLQGLEIMNDDPTEVNVLYAKCNWGDDTAQKLADLISAKFVDSGLAKPNRSGNSVKFHATLMNTRHRQSVESDNSKPTQGNPAFRGKSYQKDCFDARNILKQLGNFDFGTGQLREIHLSTRHTSGPDGFYKCLAKITV